MLLSVIVCVICSKFTLKSNNHKTHSVRFKHSSKPSAHCKVYNDTHAHTKNQ